MPIVDLGIAVAKTWVHISQLLLITALFLFIDCLLTLSILALDLFLTPPFPLQYEYMPLVLYCFGYGGGKSATCQVQIVKDAEYMEYVSPTNKTPLVEFSNRPNQVNNKSELVI